MNAPARYAVNGIQSVSHPMCPTDLSDWPHLPQIYQVAQPLVRWQEFRPNNGVSGGLSVTWIYLLVDDGWRLSEVTSSARPCEILIHTFVLNVITARLVTWPTVHDDAMIILLFEGNCAHRRTAPLHVNGCCWGSLVDFGPPNGR
jgi:hypothetical protein